MDVLFLNREFEEGLAGGEMKPKDAASVKQEAPKAPAPAPASAPAQPVKGTTVARATLTSPIAKLAMIKPTEAPPPFEFLKVG